MSEPSPSEALETYVSDRLSADAFEVVDEWLEDLKRLVGARPSRLLPTDQLHDHMPEVVRRIARFIAAPVGAVRSGMADQLRLLAELRRNQGFDVEELLVEFDALGKRVFARLARWMEEFPGEARPADVVRVAERVRQALGAVTRVTVGTYREEENEQRHEIATRLAAFAGTLTHELKNPLHAASSSARMLQEGGLSEERVARFTGPPHPQSGPHGRPDRGHP